jgi:hypothetical protein
VTDKRQPSAVDWNLTLLYRSSPVPDLDSIIALAGFLSILWVLWGVVMFFYETAATVRARRRPRA